MTARAELSAVATVLDELVGRLERIGSDLGGAERDALLSDLTEVERSLDAARRRLARVISGR
jgi:hypothetical protein